MRELPFLLIQIATLVTSASGCSNSVGEGCGPPGPPHATVNVTDDIACALAAGEVYGVGPDVCPQVCGSGVRDVTCGLPDDYSRSYATAQPVRPPPGAHSACPNVSSMVQVQCGQICLGRRTEGVSDPTLAEGASAGEYFAMCSYLESVSVYAFARLRDELRALGAPTHLLKAVGRAQRDEVRHARLMGNLARRCGAEPGQAARPPDSPRTPLQIASENAVEGCVRETYGAVVGLIGAERASDRRVRSVLRSIARDECEHAQLSWRVAQWMTSRLDEQERGAVARAVREAVSALYPCEHSAATERTDRVGLCGLLSRREHIRILELLDGAVFQHLSAA